MKDKYKKFYMMFDKRFKNLILCSNLNSDRRIKRDFSVEQLSSISYPSLIMTKIFNNLSETIGVFSAFVVFFILKSIGTSEFLAFPLCMLLGWRVAAYFKNNEKGSG